MLENPASLASAGFSSYNIVIMVKETIRQTILKQKLIDQGEHIVIGLSGGPDSVCLFHVLKQLAEEMEFSLYAVHVNHKFRPGAAEEDQAYTEELCRKEGIPCFTYIYDCKVLAEKLGLSSEEAGRMARYEAFGKTADSLVEKGVPREKIKIAVAQNADDQAETVLLRLLRGTGPDGLAGMAYKRSDGKQMIIRPLLDVWRKDIEAYCRQQQLSPHIDKTNLQPVYTRNKIRLGLIPYLKETFNPNISEALFRLSTIAGQDKDYLWECAEKAYGDLSLEDGCSLELHGLKELHPAVRSRVIMKAFQQAGLSQDITAAHLEAAERLLEEGKTSKTLDFPEGFVMKLQYEKVQFCRKKAESGQGEKKKAEKLKITLIEADEASYNKTAALFDWEKVCSVYGTAPSILLRSRQPGDYIGMRQGRKKLQDFFVDQKIPKENRDLVLFTAVGSEVLWIPENPELGLTKTRFNEKYKLERTTKKALMLEIICEI